MNLEKSIAELREIANQYSQPNSDIDSGNLFYALGEALEIIDSMEAWAEKAKELEEKLEIAKAALTKLRHDIFPGEEAVNELIDSALEKTNKIMKGK